MKAHGCYQLVFSSSCCVYGNPDHLPITEEHPIGKVTNVYGRTKYLIEEMLMDLSRAEEVIIIHCWVILHSNLSAVLIALEHHFAALLQSSGSSSVRSYWGRSH